MTTMQAYPHRHQLDAAAERRLVSAWLDEHVTMKALQSRFRLQPRDIEDLRAKHGPKAKPLGGNLAFGQMRYRPSQRKTDTNQENR